MDATILCVAQEVTEQLVKNKDSSNPIVWSSHLSSRVEIPLTLIEQVGPKLIIEYLLSALADFLTQQMLLGFCDVETLWPVIH